MSPIDPTTAAEKARLRREADCKRKHDWRLTASPADLERKRDRDREQARRRRAAKPGARPHTESLSRKQPWLLEGKSRSTWERHRAAKTSIPVRDAKTSFRSILLNGVRNDEFSSSLTSLPASTGSVRNGHGKRRPRRSSRQQSGLPMMKGHRWHCGAIVQAGISSVVSVSFGSNGGRL